MRRLIFALLGLLMGASAAAQTEPAGPKIYKWTDKNGQLHFSSSPPPGQKTEEIAVRQQSLSGDEKPALSVVDIRNKTAPAPSYDWNERVQERLKEDCDHLRGIKAALQSGDEYVSLDWGLAPVRLDSPARVEALVKTDREIIASCKGVP